MNRIIKAWQAKILGKANAGRNVTARSGKGVRGRRETLDQMIEENNQRLWYITRDRNIDANFADEHLQTLLDIRAKAEDPNYLPTLEEETAYFKATTAAARLIGDRRPETIEIYAQVERKNRITPLKYVYWLLGLSLLIALLSHGYQAAVSRQLEIMKAERDKYIEAGQTLTKEGTDMYLTMSAMCQQTLRYLTAAEQLDRYLFWVNTPPPDDTTNRASSSAPRPGMCGVLSDAVKKDRVLTPPRLTENQSNNYNALLATYQKDKKEVLASVSEYQMMEKWTRYLLDSAETTVNLFNLLVLPTMFAALGALTSATRSADARFKAMILSRIDQVGLISRVLLGIVAGATVGIVFNANATETISSGLTELGLAFAFGYAVDIFFNLLDSIKSGLGTNGNKQATS